MHRSFAQRHLSAYRVNTILVAENPYASRTREPIFHSTVRKPIFETLRGPQVEMSCDLVAY